MERLADLGVTRGCATEPSRFCPTEPVTRAQMASFLVRAFQLPPASPSQFTDTGGNSHQADIAALASSGVTKGCAVDPARYCPAAETTRAEKGTFLTRAVDRPQSLQQDDCACTALMVSVSLWPSTQRSEGQR